MRSYYNPSVNREGITEPAYTVDILCAACGYDVDKFEFEVGTCSDCGAALRLKQNTSIQVTTLPPIAGKSM